MNYKIISSVSSEFEEALESLEVKVNVLLKDGWIPSGGVSLIYDDNQMSEFDKRFIANQAVTKTD